MLTKERTIPISAHLTLRSGLEVPRRRLFRPDMAAYRFHDPELERAARTAAELDATMFPFVQYSEQAILNGIFGNCAGCVRTAISAAATAQTTINTGSFATGGVSGNMDLTPTSTGKVWIGTPGSGATQNQYTAPHAFVLTGSAATSLTIASQSIGLALGVGDFVFVEGSSAAGGASTYSGPCWHLNTLYIGLSTAAGTASQAALLAGEPTSTGTYARIVIPNTVVYWTAATAASPSIAYNNAAWTFGGSAAAWSTGASNLTAMFIADASTLAGGNIIAAGALGTPQAVASAGITLAFTASTGVSVSLT